MRNKFKAALFFLFFAFPFAATFAQTENVWAFGYHAGLDFSTGAPVPIQTNISGFGEGQASISDANGNLMFYTEGTFVWDKNGNLMPNGSELTGIVSVTSYSATSSSSQGTLIMSKPGTTSQYYVFSLTSMEQNGMGNAGKLFYSVVDMSLNGGLGDVVAGEKGIFISGGLSERMTAVVGKRCNIWLVTCSQLGKIKSFEITHSGVDTVPVVSTVGIAQEFTGYIVASPNGQKLAATKCFEHGDGLQAASIFDYDVYTGLASNPIPILDSFGGYGVCFSPDNSKLYVTASFQWLYQFDLSSGNAATIAASGVNLGGTTMTSLKLASDGKIYANSNYTEALDVIKYPNLPGVLAQFTNNALQLLPNTNCISGLPNNVPIFSFSLDTIYHSTNQYGTCLNEAKTLNVQDTSGWGYTWNTGDTSKFININTPGTYWVKYYTEPCTYSVDSFQVYFPKLVLKKSCNTGSYGAAWVMLPYGDTTNYTFTWTDTMNTVLSTTDSLNNVPSGFYNIHISNSNNCDKTIRFFIENDIYKASFTADSLICEQTTIQFTNTSDSQFDHFDWNFNDGSSSTLDEPSHQFQLPGTYSVILIATNGHCSDTINKVITVDPQLSSSFSVTPDRICVGETVHFSIEADSSILSLLWDYGDGITNRDQFANQLTHAYDKAGKMTINLIAHPRACPDVSLNDSVVVFPLPKVDLGEDQYLCLNSRPILLKNLDDNPGMNLHYKWSTLDTNSSLSVVHPGIYTLTVNADPINCSTTESVTIYKDCYIDVPNAFTPNGDGENDYFFPRQMLSKNLSAFKMQVFNRWGQIVFETQRKDGRGWDGKFNEKDQPLGVYVYVIDITIGGTGKQEHYEGNVTLLR